MSDVLCLVDHLIERSRRMLASSQHDAAREVLHDLEPFALPPARAEEVQRLLAESYLAERRYRRAHRHLRRAVKLAPRTARYHHLLGLCVASHKRGRWERAAAHFRRALELAPNHHGCRADAGLLAVRRGRVEEGLDMLRKAAGKAPDLLPKLVRGCQDAGRPEEARRAVQLARFASPSCPKVLDLWAEVRSTEVRRDQASRPGRAAGPVLLPFLRLRRVD